jgi:hypothetical protein
LPEVALFAQMRVPTGGRDFMRGQVMPGFNLAYSWKFNQLIELECNTQLNRQLDDADHFYSEFIQTANIEYDLPPRLDAFTEWFCFVPNGALAVRTQHYFMADSFILLRSTSSSIFTQPLALTAPQVICIYGSGTFDSSVICVRKNLEISLSEHSQLLRRNSRIYTENRLKLLGFRLRAFQSY